MSMSIFIDILTYFYCFKKYTPTKNLISYLPQTKRKTLTIVVPAQAGI